MLFNSIEFLIFFPIVTALYFWLPHRHRWQLLLGASCIFYMAFVPIYIAILAITIVIDYFAGILIEKSEGAVRKTYLWISIIATCAVLFVFKYYEFFNQSMAEMARFFQLNYSHEVLEILLPIGLSFHTFQSLSYVIEVYRGNQKAERHFGIYSLYVMFYPQLVAGPIERPQNLLHQFRVEHRFDYERVAGGLKLMAWGMFKKVVVADRLAVLVNTVYANPEAYDGPALIIATIFFAFQIYCDFSGYSDIAIGASQVMGFKLMDNFDRPYASRSIGEFWRRWHISLSTWFKDYLYVSLGGNRVPLWRNSLNLMITFTVSGLWHGANWTYVAWGALNGLYLVIERLTSRIRSKVSRAIFLDRVPLVHHMLQLAITFTAINITWVFFRASSIGEAIFIIKNLGLNVVGFADSDWWASFLTEQRSGMDAYDFGLTLVALLGMEVFHMTQKHGTMRNIMVGRPWLLRYATYFMLVFSILIFGVFDNPQQFIYFQF